MRDLGQQLMAAAWAATSFFDDAGGQARRLDDLLGWVEETQAQLAGLRMRLVREAQLAGAHTVIERVLASTRATTQRASADLRLAKDLGEDYPLISRAVCEGRVSFAQAEAMVSGLKKLPSRLTRHDLEQCQTRLLAEAEVLGPHELRTLAVRMLELSLRLLPALELLAPLPGEARSSGCCTGSCWVSESVTSTRIPRDSWRTRTSHELSACTTALVTSSETSSTASSRKTSHPHLLSTDSTKRRAASALATSAGKDREALGCSVVSRLLTGRCLSLVDRHTLGPRERRCLRPCHPFEPWRQTRGLHGVRGRLAPPSSSSSPPGLSPSEGSPFPAVRSRLARTSSCMSQNSL